MSTLIRIPAGHMRFVPAHRQSDDITATLPPAKWPVELVLISNEIYHAKYLDHSRIHIILAPAIQGVCHMSPAQTKFFPRTNAARSGALSQQGRHPTRPIPKCSANVSKTGLTAPPTPPRGHY
jgi:hypothetical protein